VVLIGSHVYWQGAGNIHFTCNLNVRYKDQAAAAIEVSNASEAIVFGLEYPFGIIEGMGSQHRDDRRDIG
jgi:hypothetical protein